MTTISTAAAQTAQQSNTTTTQNPLGALSENYETFLTMLTTQLKNQDPLQPQETAEFTNQLVNFSQVEQQIAANQRLDKLIASVNNGQTNQALGYIGRSVEIQSNGVPLQNGTAEIALTLGDTAAEAEIAIIDNAGRTVRTLHPPRLPGTHPIIWDGKSDAGTQLSDGTFRIEAKIKDAEGKDMANLIRVKGKVTGVDLAEGTPYLMLGSLPITLDQVMAIN